MNKEIPNLYNGPISTQDNLNQYQSESVIASKKQINTDNNQINQEEINQKSTVKIYTSQQEANKPKIEKSSILGATFMITNICLGTTIYTFATRAKRFGLVWLLFFCVVVAVINYWSIMLGVYASSKCKEDDFSDMTEKLWEKECETY